MRVAPPHLNPGISRPVPAVEHLGPGCPSQLFPKELCPIREAVALAQRAAPGYLANAHDGLTTIVFIHGVTSLGALGGIIPNVGETTARSALHYAWQSGCALYACFGTRPMAENVEPCEQNAATLIDRALANGDEHVIKFTEACLRRDALVPSPAYRAAVDHALRRMRR